ncbi:unnamed protein product [Closterium sp. Naga37s-1]|nr:unnamed protein product [Closterium sp. Naga37s-1]
MTALCHVYCPLQHFREFTALFIILSRLPSRLRPSAAALLNVKSALGLTNTSWATTPIPAVSTAFSKKWRGKAHFFLVSPLVPFPHCPFSAAALLNMAMGLTYATWATTNVFSVSSASAFPCLPSPIRPSATALLNTKAAMGLKYTTWVAATTWAHQHHVGHHQSLPCRRRFSKQWRRRKAHHSFSYLSSLPFPHSPSSATAMLNIKSTMGLTYTTWVATNPCTLNGATSAAGEWDRVTCTADGLAYSINLDSAGLQRKSFPADISKLTGLGAV